MGMIMKIMRRMNGCLSDLEVIEFALDGMEEPARAKAEKHLQGCDDCREAVRNMMDMQDGLALMAPRATPPADLADRVIQRAASVPQLNSQLGEKDGKGNRGS